MSNPSNSVEIQPVTSEIDLPPGTPAPIKENIPGDTVAALERAKFEHKKSIDRWGFRLLCGSVGLYFATYIIERLFGSTEMSKFTATFSDTLKFLISAMIGYLFASRNQ